MEIKIEVKTVPVTVNRKVKTRTVVLTEREALLLRDILGGSSIHDMARDAKGSYNYSKITDLKAAEEEIGALARDLQAFAYQVSPIK